jgi:hypothetical protein
MRSRRFIYPLVAIGIALVLSFWSRCVEDPAAGARPSVERPTSAAPGATPPGAQSPAGSPLATKPRPGTVAGLDSGSVAGGTLAEEFPLAVELNAAGSSVARDLDRMSQIMDAWRTNFPGEGNPVGENHEITAALMGDNPLGLKLIPRNHPAVNARGELCDRWGTPLRFHQLSGERMEIRSAGPDRKFGTSDDALWSPGS